MFTGKRTDRIRLPQQLRFPSDLAWRIRAMAEMSRRPIEHQILHLVVQGIRFEEASKGNEVTNGHIQSHGGPRNGD
jgi:hypothetical protein